MNTSILLQQGQKITFIDTSLLNRSIDFKNYVIYATVIKQIDDITATVFIDKLNHPVNLIFEKTKYSCNLHKCISINISKIKLVL